LFPYTTLFRSINRFTGRQMSVGTPSVKTGLLEDVYLTLQQAPAEDEGRTAAIRVIVQPMVTWLWIGGVVMLAGTVLALFPGRRRRPVDPVSAPLSTGDEGSEPDGDGAVGDGRAPATDAPEPVEVPT